MKKTLFLIALLIVNCSLTIVKAQTAEIDSLENLLQQHIEKDTVRVNLLNELAYKYHVGHLEKTLEYAKKAGELAVQMDFAKGEAESLRLIGKYYRHKANFPKAIEYIQKSMAINKALGNKKGISSCLFNTGTIYGMQGNYPKSLEYYLSSLEIDEELGDKWGISYCLNNIGLVYKKQGDILKALEYYLKSLKIKEELGNKKGISSSLSNIGLIYNKQGNYTQALEYFQKSLKIGEEIGDKEGIANSLSNIGNIYQEQGNYTQALEYHQIALKIKEEIEDEQGICYTYFDIGNVYLKTNDYAKALDYTLKSLEIANELELLYQKKEIHELLAEIYEVTRNYKKAYENHVLYKELNDSIFNEKNIKKTTGLEYQYEFEKEKQAIELEQQKKDAVRAEEEKRQVIVRNSFIAGFILMVLLVLVVLRSFLQKRKANRILAQQKKKIEETNEELNQTNEELNTTLETVSQQKEEITTQNKEITIHRDQLAKQNKHITDSINYASRIQTAVLPSKNLVEKIMPEHFILFKPRDIVSGDFYWIQKVNNYLMLAAADCTGHGVPGAFMSMLGISFLNEIVRKQEMTQANHVLDELRNQIKATLDQTGKSDEAKDGMDIAFYVIDTETNMLQYSGANNPLYIFRNNELIEYKANRQPIGIYAREKPFTNHLIQLEKGDTIYTFSDGYVDQFGGDNGRKFLSKKFKKLLLDTHHKSMQEQKQILEQMFKDWRGSLEQVDDVLVVGVKI